LYQRLCQNCDAGELKIIAPVRAVFEVQFEQALEQWHKLTLARLLCHRSSTSEVWLLDRAIAPKVILLAPPRTHTCD